MVKEKLLDYPSESSDPLMDSVVSGRRNHYSPIQEISLENGKVVVYRSSYNNGWGDFESPYHFEVSGYRTNPTGIFKFLKTTKIRLVPLEEREEIKSALINKRGGKAPEYITFQNP